MRDVICIECDSGDTTTTERGVVECRACGSKRLNDDNMAEVFRAYCCGVGHTKGTDISKLSFTLGTGRDYDLYTFGEVKGMVEEIIIASQGGELSVCQKAVLHQLKSYGVLAGFHAIAAELEERLS